MCATELSILSQRLEHKATRVVEHVQTLRSAEHAAIFCPVGSNLQLKISAFEKRKEKVKFCLGALAVRTSYGMCPCEADNGCVEVACALYGADEAF